MEEFNSGRDKFYCVRDKRFSSSFPRTDRAAKDPEGLLAIGGNLSSDNLLKAYKKGIFPWYSENNPVMWWSPERRPIIRPNQLRISRSLNKTIKKNKFSLSYNKCFDRVIKRCSASGERKGNSWITPEMLYAYIELHRLGHAHSVECWRDGKLSGGLYGVSVGKVFYGESMFSDQDDASKVALAHLCKNLVAWGYEIIDCQVPSAHLTRLGATIVSRGQFEKILYAHLKEQPAPEAWKIVGFDQQDSSLP